MNRLISSNGALLKRLCSGRPTPLRRMKEKSQRKQIKYYVDAKRVLAQGGSGGDGCISLLKLWVNDSAGPDGGDGGNGGHVVLKAAHNVKGLDHIGSILKAEDGEKGYNKDCHGKSASHCFIPVPIGTIIKDTTGTIVGDLDNEGAMFILARGGAGGKGNHFFATATQQAPVIAELGGKGEQLSYDIEVKVMAHFGLVGLPNAGKSTLLQAISRARPKVASYPFTTVKPHLGIVQYSDFEQISVADLPGLIEGSHKNRGLGIGFLKHVDRCACILLVVDLNRNPEEDLTILRREMKMFSAELCTRRQFIVGNKIDLPNSEVALADLKRNEGEDNVFGVSAKYGKNITALLNRLREIYDETL